MNGTVHAINLLNLKHTNIKIYLAQSFNQLVNHLMNLSSRLVNRCWHLIRVRHLIKLILTVHFLTSLFISRAYSKQTASLALKIQDKVDRQSQHA